MKRNFIILILFIFAGVMPAKADYITTQTFYVDADTTISVVISGTLNTIITGALGDMSTPMNINFNISTNEELPNIRLKAEVIGSLNETKTAFCCTDVGEVSSQAMALVLANGLHKPMACCIGNCMTGACTTMENANAIAYPGTVSINNSGTIHYNSTNGYFDAKVKTGTSDLTLALNASPKSGTYDIDTAQDEPDNYVVEIYLDNLP